MRSSDETTTARSGPAVRRWAAVVLVAAAAVMPAAPAGAAEPPTLRRVRLSGVVDPAGLEIALAAAGFDVLGSSGVAETVDVAVTLRGLPELRGLAAADGFGFDVVGVGRPLRDLLAARAVGDDDGRGGGAADGAGVPKDYGDLDAVVAQMMTLAESYPALCRFVDLTETYGVPTTFEGRHMHAVRISDNVDVDEDEPAALLVSAHHAREIVTPVLALYAAGQLLSQYGKDERVTAAVDGNEIWIAPVWNPDGYAHVFDADHLWRKNRRPFERGIGVDQNRNYPLGWFAEFSGSDDPDRGDYKGPEPASEPETQTMMAWSHDRRFARVIDYHSSGRETLWAYRELVHPFATFLQDEAIALSTASGYDGAERPPHAVGEHYQWQLGSMAAHAFLIETHQMFQPEYASAVEEAEVVFPGLLHHLERPASISGRVTDAETGEPLVASITYAGIMFENGETNLSGGPFGRYHAFLPEGDFDVQFTADGYVWQGHAVTVVADGTQTLDVALEPIEIVLGDFNGDGDVDFADLLTLLGAWGPCPPPPAACAPDIDGDGVVGFTDLLILLANWTGS